jgi:hypothetical protein
MDGAAWQTATAHGGYADECYTGRAEEEKEEEEREEEGVLRPCHFGAASS